MSFILKSYFLSQDSKNKFNMILEMYLTFSTSRILLLMLICIVSIAINITSLFIILFIVLSLKDFRLINLSLFAVI